MSLGWELLPLSAEKVLQISSGPGRKGRPGGVGENKAKSGGKGHLWSRDSSCSQPVKALSWSFQTTGPWCGHALCRQTATQVLSTPCGHLSPVWSPPAHCPLPGISLLRPHSQGLWKVALYKETRSPEWLFFFLLASTNRKSL